MGTMNRRHNAQNPHQGSFKKVLCVCSAGLLRSPTAAVVLSQPPFNFNTRAVGLDTSHALIPIDNVHIEWADEIVCMEQEHKDNLLQYLSAAHKKITCLDIADSFAYRDEGLIYLIKEKYQLLSETKSSAAAQM